MVRLSSMDQMEGHLRQKRKTDISKSSVILVSWHEMRDWSHRDGWRTDPVVFLGKAK